MTTPLPSPARRLLPLLRRCLAAVPALAVVATLLVVPPTSAAAETPPSSTIRKDDLSGPDRAASAYPSTASDGQLVVTAWQDYGFGGDGPEIAVAVSHDAGHSWTSPQNVSLSPTLDSARASVAVHGQQVWVVWQEGTEKTDPGVGNHDVWAVQSPDGGRTWDLPLPVHVDRADSLHPEVAIHGGQPYVSWAGLDNTMRLATSADQGLDWAVTDLGPANGQVLTTSTATADGRLYLTWTGPKRERFDVGGVHLLAIGPDHAPSDVVDVVPPGTTVDGLTVDAAGSTVALAWSERANWSAPQTARVAVSRDGGRTFADTASMTDLPGSSTSSDVLVHDELVTAAYVMPGGEQRTRRSDDGGRSWQPPALMPDGGSGRLSGSPVDSSQTEPTAAFDYSVPDRFGLDADGDGLTDYRTDPAWLSASLLPVDVDACASVGRTGPLDRYTVTVGGRTWTSETCELRIEVPGEGTHGVRLEVRRADGAQDVAEREIEVVDHLVLSLGDSVASGEGVPDVEKADVSTPARWVDERCHRSAQSGPAEAALLLEQRDPRSSVTFVSLACSGASVLGEDVAHGGLLTPYEGFVKADPPLPPQVDQARALVGDRTVDAMMVSIGANDLRFSQVVERCIAVDCLLTDGIVVDDVRERLTELPSHYAELAAALDGLVDPDRVFLSEYFDSLHDEHGDLDLSCVAPDYRLGIGPEEARFALTGVMEPLNAAVDQAAAAHGWNHVGGVFDSFRDHGYCSRDGWVVRLEQSIARQGGVGGAFHPNRAGHDVYGAAIAAATRSVLPVVDAPEAPQEDPADPVEGLQRSDVHLVYLQGQSVHVVPVLEQRPGQAPAGPVDLSQTTTQGYSGDGHVTATPQALVATWMEMTRPDGDVDGFEIKSAAVQTAPPNLRVDRVVAVQAPDDATTAAAGKPVVARTEVVSSFATTRRVPVEVRAPGHTVRSVVALEPGRSVLHLPVDGAPVVGESYSVEVVVDPDDVVEESDETDGNQRSAEQPVQQGRPLDLLFVAVQPTGEQATDCDVVRRAERQSGAFLRDALPLAPDLVQTRESCATVLRARAGAGSKDDAKDLLFQAGRLALSAGVDLVVGVTPSGYLGTGTTSTPAIGLALLGSAQDGGHVPPGLLVDPVSPTGPTTTHEVGHAFGLGHVTGSRASGLRTSTMEVMAGEDLMAASASPQQWVGRTTWEHLLRRLRGTASSPRLAEDTGSLLLSLDLAPDGAVTAPTWQRSDRTPTTPLAADGDLQLQYLDADGGELASTGLPVADVEAVTTHGDGGGELGARTDALVPWVDGTGQLVVRRGEDVLLTRSVSGAAPTVALSTTGPAEAAVGDVVPLAWTGADGDGDALTYAVDLSTDGGGSWTPVATALTATSLDVLVEPRHTGTTLSFRVTATDGVLVGAATGGAVAVPAPAQDGSIAFVLTRDELYTDARGDLALVAPGSGTITRLTVGERDRHPSWSPDGRRLVFERYGSLRTIAADGTDDRELLPRHGGDAWSCPEWSPDGSRIAYRSTNDLWVMAADGSDRRKVAQIVASPVYRSGCPAWSPDGTRTAFVAERGSLGPPPHVYVADMASGAVTGVPGTQMLQLDVDWSSRGDLMANVGIPPAASVQVLTPDGALVSTVTRDHVLDPAFSPRGDRAVGKFQHSTDGGSPRWELQVRPLDTPALPSSDARITDLRALDPGERWHASEPAWQPLLAPGGDGSEDAPPALAQLGDAYTATEAQPLLLDATPGLRPGGEVPSYTWDLDDDGAFDDARGATATWVPDDDGTRTVRLRAELADGTSATDSAPVTVANAPPVVTGGTLVAALGAPAALGSAVRDAAGDELSARVSWSSGAAAEDVPLEAGRPGTWSVAGAHAYDTAGTTTAHVEVCDDDGGCTQADVRVDVAARAPDATAMTPSSGPAVGGTPVLLTGRFLGGATVTFDGEPADVLRSSSRSVLVAAPPLDPGATVDVVVTTSGGTSGSLRWTADNAEPVVRVAPAASTPSGTALDVPVSVEDPEGRPTQLVVSSTPAHGTLTLTTTGVRYVPTDGWAGEDVFTVAADDGVSVGPSAVVTVTTGSGAPVAAGETVHVAAATASVRTAELLANDVDPEGAPLTVVAVEAGSGGSVRLAGDVVEVQLTGETPLRFRYTVQDPTGMRATTTSWAGRTAGPSPTPVPTTPTPAPTSPAPAPTAPVPTTTPPAGTPPAPAPTTSQPPGGPRPVDDACPTGLVPEDGFTDVGADDVHEAAVDCLVWWGVARGRTPTKFAPSQDVTRAQMASFVANVVTSAGGTLPEPSRDWFDDDDGSVHERAVNQLREAGIVAGRTDGTFGPDLAVSRGAMAKYLVLAHELLGGAGLAASSDHFSDDDGTTHESHIDAAAAAGLAAGLGGGRYEPHGPVGRGQMASFLVRLLDLLVEDGHAVRPPGSG